MSVAEALMAARTAGIRILIDGGDLVLDAPAPPPPDVLGLLTRHKAAIVALLHARSDGWSAQDWQRFFDERAVLAERDGGLPLDEAKDRAFACCVGEWFQRNPVRSPSGRCDLCGQSQGLLLPYLTGYSISNPGHTWLHQECAQAWHRERRVRAVAALVALGISSPAKFPNESGKNGPA